MNLPIQSTQTDAEVEAGTLLRLRMALGKIKKVPLDIEPPATWNSKLPETPPESVE